MTDNEQVSDIKDIRKKGGVIEEHLVHTPEETIYTEEQHATQAFLPQSERHQLRIRRIKRFIYFITTTIVIFISIRFLLQAFNANPDSPFFIFISIISGPFIAPFVNLFGPSAYAISMPALLFAIPIYYLFAWIAASLVSFMMRRSTAHSKEVRL